MKPSDTRASAAAVLALFMWSGTPVANKVVVAYMGGLTAGVLRSLLAGAIALGVALAFRLPVPSTGKERLLLILSGSASFAVWPALGSVGVQKTTVSHAAVIMAMIPIFTVLIAHLLERRLPKRGWWFGAIAAFAATVVLVTQRGAGPGAPARGASTQGDLIILTGCVVCAIGYVAGGRLSAKIGTMATTFWGLAAALVLLIPIFALIAKETAWAEVPVRGWLGIAWMTGLSSLAGYALWFYALGKGGISKISTLQLAMPGVTIAAAALILNETITASMLLVAAVILAGTSWAHRHAR